MVETDTTVNNTGEDLMGETSKNTVPLSNNNKRSMTLVDTENNSAGEDYFPSLKKFQTCSSQLQYQWIFSEDTFSYILKHFHSFAPDAELEGNILKHSPIPSHAPPPASFDEILRGFLKENHKCLLMHEDD